MLGVLGLRGLGLMGLWLYASMGLGLSELRFLAFRAAGLVWLWGSEARHHGLAGSSHFSTCLTIALLLPCTMTLASA